MAEKDEKTTGQKIADGLKRAGREIEETLIAKTGHGAAEVAQSLYSENGSGYVPYGPGQAPLEPEQQDPLDRARQPSPQAAKEAEKEIEIG